MAHGALRSYWRILLPTLLLGLLATACVTPSALPKLTAELSVPATSNERCLTIVRRLRHADLRQTGSALVDLLASERFQFPRYIPSGCEDANPRIEVRIQTAVHEIFEAYFAGPGTEAEKAEFLCQLLGSRHDTEGRAVLLRYLEHECWHPVAEAPVAALATEPNTPPELRVIALSLLIRRCDPNRYCTQGVALIGEWPLHQTEQLCASEGREMVFRNIVGAADWSALSASNRDQFIRIGFKTVREGRSISPVYGYFVACQLGSALKIQGCFKPDQSAPQYQGEGRLKESFFEDTVRNALAWADANGY